MSSGLQKLKAAILVADGFEQSEFQEPKKALEKLGASIEVVSPNKESVKAWKDKNWADTVSVDVTLENANPKDYGLLILPGGVINPDKLRTIPRAIDFIRHFVQDKKPIAAICHAPWVLIEAEAVSGKTLTSWVSLKSDLTNAGAHWVDKEVVRDGNLITSRKPEDLVAFTQEMIKYCTELGL